MSISTTTSADRLYDVYGNFLDDQLGNDPIAVDSRITWKTDQQRLGDANQSLKDALREQLSVRSRRVWEGPKMRNAIRAFANTLIEMGNGNRNTLVYRSYIPAGMSSVSRTHLGRQIAVTRSILFRLETEENETLRAEGEKLRAAVESAEAIERDWEAVQVKVTERRDALEKAKLVWLAAYRRVEGELIALHPEDSWIVSSFFLKRTKRKSNADASNSDDGNGGSSGGDSNGSGEGSSSGAENSDARGADADGVTAESREADGSLGRV